MIGQAPSQAITAHADVYGLVLAGGRSTRMQKDKAWLRYHGVSQLEWAAQMLARIVSRVFVSIRADQVHDPLRARFEQIVDEHVELGPLAGILAAQARFPGAAWMVLACDLPFLDEVTLRHLVSAREPGRLATAYRSAHDGLPEPLCAIYEPSSRDPLLARVAGGRSCPRKFLLTADAAIIDLPRAQALDNINTPHEYGAAVHDLRRDPPASVEASSDTSGDSAGDDRPTAAKRRIRIQYYAILREQAGTSAEEVTTDAATPRELFEELRSRHQFSLAAEMLRVAINAEFGQWTHRLRDGDSVVFIPPVAGG